jgi:hypothetical protein
MAAVPHASTAAKFDFYYVIWTVVGVVTCGGALYKTDQWRAQKAIKQYKIDEAIKEAERKAEHGLPLDNSDKLDILLKRTKSNGGNTDDVGDVSKRNETLLLELRKLFFEHLGWSKAITDMIEERLADQEDALKEHERECPVAKAMVLVAKEHEHQQPRIGE